MCPIPNFVKLLLATNATFLCGALKRIYSSIGVLLYKDLTLHLYSFIGLGRGVHIWVHAHFVG